jgi:hypothetical protein
MEQAKHGGDHSSRAAQLQARENEQKALSLWLKGATFEQVAAAGFGMATANGAWRAVHRALARIPKEDADQAREAQLARLQALRLLLWNHAGADPIKAAEALIKLEARVGATPGARHADPGGDHGSRWRHAPDPGAAGRGDGGRYAGTGTLPPVIRG